MIKHHTAAAKREVYVCQATGRMIVTERETLALLDFLWRMDGEQFSAYSMKLNPDDSDEVILDTISSERERRVMMSLYQHGHSYLYLSDPTDEIAGGCVIDLAEQKIFYNRRAVPHHQSRDGYLYLTPYEHFLDIGFLGILLCLVSQGFVIYQANNLIEPMQLLRKKYVVGDRVISIADILDLNPRPTQP